MAGTPACAGAFPLNGGEYQLISSWIFGRSSVAFNPKGLLEPAPAYRSHEFSSLLEYGYDADTTLIFKPGFERLDTRLPFGVVSSGGASVEAGARRRLATMGDVTLSAQAFTRVPAYRSVGSASDSRLRFEAGLAAGLPFHLFPGALFSFAGFLDVSASWIKQFGFASDEARLEATLGLHSSERMMVLYQVFSAWSLQSSASGPPARRHKIQSSVVYLMSPEWRLQLGVFTTVAGSTTRYERGVMSAVWRRF